MATSPADADHFVLQKNIMFRQVVCPVIIVVCYLNLSSGGNSKHWVSNSQLRSKLLIAIEECSNPENNKFNPGNQKGSSDQLQPNNRQATEGSVWSSSSVGGGGGRTRDTSSGNNNRRNSSDRKDHRQHQSRVTRATYRSGQALPACTVQCVLSKLEVVGENGLLQETLLIKLLDETVTNQQDRMDISHDVHSCFQKMNSVSEDDSCILAQRFAQCLDLKLDAIKKYNSTDMPNIKGPK